MVRRSTAAAAILALTLGCVAALTTAGAPGYAEARTRTSAYRVTATTNTTEPLLDSTIKITGKVKPVAPRAEVRLQVRYRGHHTWKTRDTAKLDRNSRFKLKDEITSTRQRFYRVVKPADEHHASGRSDELAIAVYTWRKLASTPPEDVLALGGDSDVTMAGVRYPNSLHAQGTGQDGGADYQVDRCTSLDAVYGVDDAAPDGSSATWQVRVDGTVRHQATYVRGQAQRVVTDLHGAGVLTLLFHASGPVAAVGNPWILCTG